MMANRYALARPGGCQNLADLPLLFNPPTAAIEVIVSASDLRHIHFEVNPPAPAQQVIVAVVVVVDTVSAEETFDRKQATEAGVVTATDF